MIIIFVYKLNIIQYFTYVLKKGVIHSNIMYAYVVVDQVPLFMAQIFPKRVGVCPTFPYKVEHVRAIT